MKYEDGNDFGGPYYRRGMFRPDGRMLCFFKGNSSTQSNPNNSQTVTDNRVAATEGSTVATNGSTVTNQNLTPQVIAENNDAITKLASSESATLGEGFKSLATASEAQTYDATKAAQLASEAASKASESASYNNTLVAKAAADAAAKAASDSSYSSEQSAKAAIGGNVDVTKSALAENSDVSKAALQANSGAITDALSFGEHVNRDALSVVNNAGNNVADQAKNVTAGSFGFSKDLLNFGESIINKQIDANSTLQQDTNALIKHSNEVFSSGLVENKGLAPSSATDNIVKYVTIAATILGVFVALRGSRKSA